MIRALETRRLFDRLLSGLICFVSILIVGLTVSRGALVALALGAVIVFRKQLRRGFVPLLALVILVAGGVAFGVFDNAIAHYTQRGAEETGRGEVFPLAMARFVHSPIFGVGASNLSTPTPQEPTGRYTHDALLFIALTSGVVPLILFLAYWTASFRRALKAPPGHPYASYLMPLLAYCSFFLFVHDSIFMNPWYIGTFCACMMEYRPAGVPGANQAERLRRQPPSYGLSPRNK
jgi:O-antigen ligase